MALTHLISRAVDLYHGNVFYGPYHTAAKAKAGLKISPLSLIDFGAIAAADRDGLVTSVDPANNATLTLNGAAVSGGVATLATPRNLSIYSASTDESAKSITFTGTDEYGKTLVETITGPDSSGPTKIAYGKKAFKTVTSAVATGNFGTIEVGFGTKIGLPFRVTAANQVHALINGRLAAPYIATGVIAAVGTAQDVVMNAPLGGVVTKLMGSSAAANGTSASTVTVTNGSLEVGVLAFGSSYAALTAIEDTSLLNTRLAANGVLKATTDGTGDGAGNTVITAVIDPAVVTIADDTTATATTGDVRGTIDFGFIPDAALLFSAFIAPADKRSKNGAFGISQYAG